MNLITLILKSLAILIVLDGIGSLVLPARLQRHSFILDAGRAVRAGIGILLFFAL